MTVRCTEEMPVASRWGEAWNLIFPAFPPWAQKLSQYRLLDWKFPTYNVLEADMPAQFQITDYLCKVLKSQLKKQLGIFSTRHPLYIYIYIHIYLTHTHIYTYICIYINRTTLFASTCTPWHILKVLCYRRQLLGRVKKS